MVLVVVTSNKGLCGAFNSNVLKLANQRIEHWRSEGATLRLVCIGKKASEQMAKLKDVQLDSKDALLDSPSFDDIASLADTLLDDFADRYKK